MVLFGQALTNLSASNIFFNPPLPSPPLPSPFFPPPLPCPSPYIHPIPLIYGYAVMLHVFFKALFLLAFYM